MRSATLGIRGGAFGLVLLLGLPLRLQATTADDLCLPAANPCVVSTAVTVTSGSDINVGNRELRITTGGALDVFSGMMTIEAARLTIGTGGFVRASGTATTGAGTIAIDAADVSISGTLSADGAPGGTITLMVANALTLTGALPVRSISANALARADVGGTIQISTGTATIAGPLTATGGLDAIGGDITVDARGNLTISSSVDASGGDGGSLDIEAGANLGAGDLILAATSSLKGDSTTAGGFGGSVDVAADGEAGSGNLTANGLISAVGRTGGIDMGGGAGGCISLSADGDIRLPLGAARLTVEGGGPDGDGGEIELLSTRGVIDFHGSATASSPGPESSGGSVSLDAGANLTLTGSLLATAGDAGGGEISLSSGAASVTVAQAAVCDASGQSGGTGGAICLESGTGPDGPHSVVVQGRLLADGGPLAGFGGSIEIAAADSARVSATGSLHAAGALGGGNGGTISLLVNPGSAFIEGPLTVSGGSPTGLGGVISIEAGAADTAGRIAVNAQLDARGFGDGGEIGLSGSGGVDVRSNVLASSSAGVGGIVQIDAQGVISIGATVSVDGSVQPSETMPLNGRNEVTGCTVTVCTVDGPSCPGSGAGTLTSLGPGGVNRITGRDIAAVLGTMRANPTSGRNELVYDGTAQREPLRIGPITPAARLIVDRTLLPCPRCGNGVIDPPETCDEGDILDGDGCSAVCQIEAPIPGDANGDFIRSRDDLGFIITEIFDGDGDSIGTVSAGAFAGGPGADANGDERVSVADVSATARLLGQ